MGRSHLEYGTLSAEPGSGPMMAELDRVVAANVTAALSLGEPCYDVELHDHLATRLAPLDAGRVDEDLGVRRAADFAAATAMLEELSARPRGATLVILLDDGCQGFCSDGHGGFDGFRGEQFAVGRADSPLCRRDRLYGTVFQTAAYERKGPLRNEVVAHSFEAAGVRPGHEARGVRLGGKEWTRLRFEGFEPRYVGGGAVARLTGARRGMSARRIDLDHDKALRAFGVEVSLPPAYGPADPARLTPRLAGLVRRRAADEPSPVQAMLAGVGAGARAPA